jgi:hypothetical protein
MATIMILACVSPVADATPAPRLIVAPRSAMCIATRKIMTTLGADIEERLSVGKLGATNQCTCSTVLGPSIEWVWARPAHARLGIAISTRILGK